MTNPGYILIGKKSYELKSCPFCGGEAGMEHNTDGHTGDWDNVWVYYVYCDSCGAKTAKFEEAEAAVKSWNQRHKGNSKTTLVGVR